MIARATEPNTVVIVGERRHELLRIRLVVGLAVLLSAVAHEVHRKSLR